MGVSKLGHYRRASQIDLEGERANLTALYSSGTNLVGSRSRVARAISENAAFREVEFNKTFDLTEYFGYLRCDPDPGGYEFWLDVLNDREPGNYPNMVCAFITSEEYQRRFSSIVTTSNREFGR